MSHRLKFSKAREQVQGSKGETLLRKDGSTWFRAEGRRELGALKKGGCDSSDLFCFGLFDWLLLWTRKKSYLWICLRSNNWEENLLLIRRGKERLEEWVSEHTIRCLPCTVVFTIGIHDGSWSIPDQSISHWRGTTGEYDFLEPNLMTLPLNIRRYEGFYAKE